LATKYHGKTMLAYVSTSGSGSPVLVGALRALTVDNTVDDVDTTEFGALNRTSVIGFPASRGTFEGFWASDDTTMRQASQSPDGCNLAIYPSSLVMTKYLGGPAWVDMSMRGAVDAAVTTTYNWRARGNIINQL